MGKNGTSSWRLLLKSMISDLRNRFINRFDAGATLGVNLQFNKFVIGLGYDYGFLKINKESYDDEKDTFNGNIRVSVGYIF